MADLIAQPDVSQSGRLRHGRTVGVVSAPTVVVAVCGYLREAARLRRCSDRILMRTGLNSRRHAWTA